MDKPLLPFDKITHLLNNYHDIHDRFMFTGKYRNMRKSDLNMFLEYDDNPDDEKVFDVNNPDDVEKYGDPTKSTIEEPVVFVRRWQDYIEEWINMAIEDARRQILLIKMDTPNKADFEHKLRVLREELEGIITKHSDKDYSLGYSSIIRKLKSYLSDFPVQDSRLKKSESGLAFKENVLKTNSSGGQFIARLTKALQVLSQAGFIIEKEFDLIQCHIYGNETTKKITWLSDKKNLLTYFLDSLRQKGALKNGTWQKLGQTFQDKNKNPFVNLGNTSIKKIEANVDKITQIDRAVALLLDL